MGEAKKLGSLPSSRSTLWTLSKLIFWVIFAIAVTLTVVVKSEDDFLGDEDSYEDSLEDFFENREGRSMLGVKVSNEDCTGSNNREGICVSSQTCKRRGSRVGTCANGYGACCNIVANCTAGQQCPIRFNGTRIVLASGDTGNYRYIINRPNGISQVKLDFLSTTKFLEADNNIDEGDCVMERLTVMGSPSIGGGQTITVCGDLTGQHMYLDYGDSDRIMMNIRKTITGSTANIRVTYIRTRQRIVPPSCLQYYTDKDDTIKSFGFPRQLNRQFYTICIESNTGADSVQLTPCNAASGIPDSYFITGNPSTVDTDTCSGTTDWIQIFGFDRQCGSTFPNKVTLDVAPFVIRVNFDASEASPAPMLPILQPPPAPPCMTVDPCYQCNGDPDFCTCSLIENPVDPACMALVGQDQGDSTNTGFCFNFNRG